MKKVLLCLSLIVLTGCRGSYISSSHDRVSSSVFNPSTSKVESSSKASNGNETPSILSLQLDSARSLSLGNHNLGDFTVNIPIGASMQIEEVNQKYKSLVFPYRLTHSNSRAEYSFNTERPGKFYITAMCDTSSSGSSDVENRVLSFRGMEKKIYISSQLSDDPSGYKTYEIYLENPGYYVFTITKGINANSVTTHILDMIVRY